MPVCSCPGGYPACAVVSVECDRIPGFPTPRRHTESRSQDRSLPSEKPTSSMNRLRSKLLLITNSIANRITNSMNLFPAIPFILIFVLRSSVLCLLSMLAGGACNRTTRQRCSANKTRIPKSPPLEATVRLGLRLLTSPWPRALGLSP